MAKKVSVLNLAHFGSSVSIRSFVRLGSAISALDYVSCGSALSLRSYVRLGSSFSVSGSFVARAEMKISVLNNAQFGSSLSMRSFARIGSSVSILHFMQLGSSLSMRSVARLGSAVSIVEFAHFGSAMSCRSFGRFGSAVSVLSFGNVGSSMSLRSYTRLGSNVSVLGASYFGSLAKTSVYDMTVVGSSLSIRSFSRLGGSLSALQFMELGSSISLRSSSRFGSAISALSFVHFGSSLSMRSFARLGSSLSVSGQGARIKGGLTLEAGDKLGLDGNTGKAYVTVASNHINMYATDGTNADRKLSTSDSGGTLHGTWVIEGSGAVTSDERMKDHIRPLYKTLSEFHRRYVGLNATAETATSINATVSQNVTELALAANQTVAEYEDTVARREAAALFRELKPVSYTMKGLNPQAKEAKSLHFGFIAQEVERLLPDMVIDTDVKIPGTDSYKKALKYNDIIALITLTLQQEMASHEKLWTVVSTHEERIKALERELLELKRSGSSAQTHPVVVKRDLSTKGGVKRDDSRFEEVMV
jgi:hypothetical protein